jgi:uncharacterized protein with HEPN domain
MTTPRDDPGFLHEILDHAERAVEKVRSINFDQFMDDENLRLAVTHLVMLVGEIANRLSPEFCQNHPDFPIREAVAVRNRIVHASYDVDYHTVLDIAQNHLPPLSRAVRDVLHREYGY